MQTLYSTCISRFSSTIELFVYQRLSKISIILHRKLEGIFEELMHHLRESVRKAFGKAISPSVGLIDSRCVRTSHHIDSSEYGIDGGKKVKGRKEHIIVDTLGLPLAAKVHAANIHDSVGAVEPIKQLRYIFPRPKKIIADGGYRGKLADTVKDFG